MAISLFRRLGIWRPLALAAGLGLAAQGGVRAQGYGGWDYPEARLEHRLTASGYRLLGPVARNGGLYLVDVEGRPGLVERLLIDAHSGELVQRFQIRSLAPPTYAAAGPDRQLRRDPPRPPAMIGALEPAPVGEADISLPAPPLRVVRLDPAPAPEIAAPPRKALPQIIEVAPPAARAKPRVVKRRLPASPVDAAKVTAPGAGKPSVAAPTEDLPGRADAPPPVADAPAPPVADVKSKEEAAAAAPKAEAAPAPAKAEAARRKPLNDLPVDPLE